MSERVEEKPPVVVNGNGKPLTEVNSNGKLSENIGESPLLEESQDVDSSHQTETSENENKSGEVNSSRRRLPIFIVAGVLLIGAISGTIYWLYARQYESTDDAFLDGDIVQVSPKLSAYVSKVYIHDNQQVKKGDLLVELDAKDYQARLETAKAQLQAAKAQRGQAEAGVELIRKTTVAGRSQASSNVETARSNVEQTRLAAQSKKGAIRQASTAVKTAQANLAQTKAQVPQAEANLRLAQIEFDRRQELYNRGDVSKQMLDQATTTLQTAQAQVDAARKQVDAAASRVAEADANVAVAEDNYRQALAQINLTQSQVNESAGRLADAEAAPERIAVNESQVGSAEAQIAQAETAVHQAELELSYTKIYAPEDGFVTRKVVQEGQLVQPGTALMALSQSEIWVVANFKETQLADMKIGQGVDVHIDAFPNKIFHGKIDSFQVGTGSRFSVLPPENATGNYVKVVQRIPVKIVFDETPDDVHLLAPGMSVQPKVKVR
ncbi:MAG: efflux RND transporter periplasmic adaptor subunit [Pyrinomonadaceae bacterium]